MDFAELNLEQRRRVVDVQQVFEAWREASIDFRRNRGSVRWKHSGNMDYLFYQPYRGVERSRGPRSEETERFEREFLGHREQLRAAEPGQEGVRPAGAEGREAAGGGGE